MANVQNGAVIFAKDILRIANFYANTTDLKICEKDNSHVKLESSSFQLVVLKTPKHIAQTIDITVPPVPREQTPIKLVFFVDSIEKAREVVKNFGGKLKSNNEAWEYDKHKVCDGCDPEGNVFQLRAPVG